MPKSVRKSSGCNDSLSSLFPLAPTMNHAASRQLGMNPNQAQFYASPILKFQVPVKPDVVLALHACDTATDEALAMGIKQVQCWCL